MRHKPAVTATSIEKAYPIVSAISRNNVARGGKSGRNEDWVDPGRFNGECRAAIATAEPVEGA